MKNIFYVPIIKGKLNDIKGIGKLNSEARHRIKPMIELVPMGMDSKISVDAHLDKFVNYVINHYADGEMYIDLYGFLPGDKLSNGVNAVIGGFQKLFDLKQSLTPTYGFERDDMVWSELKNIVSSFNKGFCFRVLIDDLDDNAEYTWQRIIERTTELGLPASDVDILIDLRYVGGRDKQYFKDLVIDFIALNQSIGHYRNIIISGSSALKTVTEIPKDGFASVSRNELGIWLDIHTDIDENLSVCFSDYGVVHPDYMDGGGFFKHMNAKIRYTVGSDTVYFRGHGLNHPESDYDQYYDIAERVYLDARYLGSDFSYGDEYIAEHALRETDKTGSPATWVLADTNHHVAFVAMQVEILGARIAEQRYNSVDELMDMV